MKKKIYEVIADEIKYSDNGSSTTTKVKGDVITFKNDRTAAYLKGKIKEVELEPKKVAESTEYKDMEEALKKAAEEKQLEKDLLTEVLTDMYNVLDEEALLKLQDGTHKNVAVLLDIKVANNVTKAATFVEKIKEAVATE